MGLFLSAELDPWSAGNTRMRAWPGLSDWVPFHGSVRVTSRPAGGAVHSLLLTTFQYFNHTNSVWTVTEPLRGTISVLTLLLRSPRIRKASHVCQVIFRSSRGLPHLSWADGSLSRHPADLRKVVGCLGSRAGL